VATRIPRGASPSTLEYSFHALRSRSSCARPAPADDSSRGGESLCRPGNEPGSARTSRSHRPVDVHVWRLSAIVRIEVEAIGPNPQHSWHVAVDPSLSDSPPIFRALAARRYAAGAARPLHRRVSRRDRVGRLSTRSCASGSTSGTLRSTAMNLARLPRSPRLVRYSSVRSADIFSATPS